MLKTAITILIAILIGILVPRSGAAQLEAGESIDKIVAVVGDEIIMKSDVDAFIIVLSQQNPTVDPSNPELRKQILDELINEKLIIAKAIEDSIQIADEEISQRLEFWLDQNISRLGSKERVEEAYKMSIEQIMFNYREQFKKQLLSERMKQKMFGSTSVSPKEVREFYDEYKDSIPIVPEQIDLYHIVKNIDADYSEREGTYELARRVRDSILQGGEFEEYVERYSHLKGDAANLGWIERGRFFHEFENAAFALQPGEVSLPVKTPLGYHLIQTLEKNENSINARQIVFKIGQRDEDREKTVKLLLELKKRVEEGEDFEDLAKEYSDDADTKGFGGFIGKIEKASAPPATWQKVSSLKEGEVSEPMPYGADPSNPSYHILYVKKHYPAHKANLEQDYKKIEQFALAFKRNKEMKEWIERLREELYWEIKE